MTANANLCALNNPKLVLQILNSDDESPFPIAMGKGRGWGRKSGISVFSLLTWFYFCAFSK